MSTRRLHVVVRADLEPGMMLAQSNHATQDFGRRFPNEDTGDTMIVLEASHADLGWLCAKAMREQVACMPFFEPDMGGELTAAAFGNDAKKMLADLPLALSKRAVKGRENTFSGTERQVAKPSRTSEV